MSHDYFSNRQDRYIKFQDKDLTRYYCDLVDTVSSFSYSLQNEGSTFYLGMETGVPDPVKESTKFKNYATKSMRSFMKKWSDVQQSPKDASFDTTLYPLIQMGPLGIRQDERVTLNVLDHVLHHAAEQDGASKAFITSGYFNFEERYSKSIINSKAADVCLIAASPEVRPYQRIAQAHVCTSTTVLTSCF